MWGGVCFCAKPNSGGNCSIFVYVCYPLVVVAILPVHRLRIWLKNPDNLTEMQKETLGSLKDMNLKTVRAYNLKLSLQVFWSIEDRLLAEDYLKKWYFWATHSRIKPMIEVAKTIKAHWNGILNYFDSRITNGILEGTNSVWRRIFLKSMIVVFIILPQQVSGH